jgi:hypothetical protein
VPLHRGATTDPGVAIEFGAGGFIGAPRHVARAESGTGKGAAGKPVNSDEDRAGSQSRGLGCIGRTEGTETYGGHGTREFRCIAHRDKSDTTAPRQ